MMLRRTLKVIAWIAGGVIGLVALAYAAMLAINWNDREPSESALRFERLHHERPAVSDQDNAYVFMLGFDAAPDANVARAGLEHIQWIRKINEQATWDSTGKPLREPYDYAGARDPRVSEFARSCNGHEPTCIPDFSDGTGIYETWLAAEPWLLSRYEALIGHRDWREAIPWNGALELPAYSLVLDGQKLLMLKANELARRNEYAGASALLEADMRFWRMALTSSDSLINKMIAILALKRHFTFGSAIIRNAPAREATAVLARNWYEPFGPSELSLQRAIMGEWFFASRVVPYGIGGEHAHERGLRDALYYQFYQHQDTLNRFADRYSKIIEALDVPLNQYEEAIVQVSQMADFEAPAWHPYNPVGSVFFAMGLADFGDYAARTSDLEGLRRAALAAVVLREKGVRKSDVAAALAQLDLRNPYDDRPFAWNGEERTIVFRGLAKNPRDEHRIRY